MDIKEEEVTELLDAIIWGRRIVEVLDRHGEERVFVFRPLTLEERNMGQYVHKQAERQARRRGVSTRDELTKDAVAHGIWKKSYETEAKLLREEHNKLLDELRREEEANKKRRSPTTKLTKLRKRFQYITNTLLEIDSNYTRYIDLPSIEYLSECERGNYFLSCTTLSFPEMKPIWATLDDLEHETDTQLAAALLRMYYTESLADEAAIRRVARSGFWRCKWMGSKKNRGVKTLFNREMYDLTLDQFRLVYWSQVYDSAYESMDAPSDNVIDDDKLFDRWLEEQHQKRKAEHKKSAFNKKVSHLTKDGQEVGFNVQGEFCEECICGVKDTKDKRPNRLADSTHAPDCSYGVYIYYNKEKKIGKIEEVQSANPEAVRRILGNEQKRLANKDASGIEEQFLRGDNTRSALGMDTSFHGKGETGRGKQGRARAK